MKDDLISRAALLGIYKNWLPQLTKPEDAGDRNGVETCIAVLKDAPAVDAEPVRHAAWVYEIDFEDESKRDDFDVTCTGCGALFRADNRDDAEIVIMDRWDYCPFCGAKMDAEENKRDA